MVTLVFDKQFVKKFSKADSQMQEKIRNQIKKIVKTPELGKPMKYSRKGTREVYISPYRMSYLFQDETIIIADLCHKDNQ